MPPPPPPPPPLPPTLLLAAEEDVEGAVGREGRPFEAPEECELVGAMFSRDCFAMGGNGCFDAVGACLASCAAVGFDVSFRPFCNLPLLSSCELRAWWNMMAA